MKKLLVLSVLLGLLVLPVFADHVSADFGGDDTFGFIGDFGDAEAEKIDLTFDVMIGIDDYNSLTWSQKNLAAAGAIALDKALVTTDLGMWLDLPVGVKVMWGYDDPDANEFAVTSGYENEQVYDLSPAEYWGIGFLISYNIIEVELAFDPGIAGTWLPGPPPTGDQGSILAGLAVKEAVPGLNAEVYYFQGGNVATDVYDEGQIAVGASYATEVAGIGLDTGVSFKYPLGDADWAFGLGVAASMDMFDVTLGLDGNETDTLHGLTATVMVSPVDMVSIYAGLEFSFAEDDVIDLVPPISLTDESETFQGADIGLNAHVGIVEIYLGYLITSQANGEWKSDFGDTWSADGGAYIKFDVDY